MRILALDVGAKRIGLAFADTAVRIAVPRTMISADGDEFAQIFHQYQLEKAELIVCGLPRNNSGEETRQTDFVRQFVDQLKKYFAEQNTQLQVIFQDESFTSVVAEEHLDARHHGISQSDRAAGKVDVEAATLILQDFLERADLDTITKGA